ncbi:MAG: GlsB/YeaQ/YmgE family stress response membrane protein [Anaerolineae bacterium]|nr:GlsB/YeaQ/YmgE family stress response membrane protein [Anaerolineae bacterium]
MGWLAWLIVGAIAGWGARMVMKTNGNQGLFMYIIVGSGGAFIGLFLFSQINTTGITGFNIWSVFVAFIGAVVLLAALRLLKGQRILPR